MFSCREAKSTLVPRALSIAVIASCRFVLGCWGGKAPGKVKQPVAFGVLA